jgi:predicted  nucleic acid-binding Zn-ribbon protein
MKGDNIMAQLQAILKYQEIDAKIYKVERDLAASEERKEYAKVRKFLETAAPEKLEALEMKARSLRAEAEELVKQYERLEGTLKDFDNLDELVTEGADISFYRKKAQSKIEQLKKMRTDLNALTAAIKETDEEYQKLKKQVLAIEKKAPEVYKKYKELKAVKDAEKKPYEEELATLQKDIPAGFLEIYKTKRKEKIFPIVGQINGNRCPYCSMDLPIAARSKLSGGGWIECENHICNRILFE